MQSYSFNIPVRTTTGAGNSRAHWGEKHRQSEAEREAVRRWWPAMMTVTLPVTVQLTRVSPGDADDDNAYAGLKYIRDEIAAQLGVDDGRKDKKWLRFEHQDPVRGARGEWRVEVRITEREAPAGEQRRVAKAKSRYCLRCQIAIELMLKGQTAVVPHSGHCGGSSACRCWCRPKKQRRVKSPRGLPVDLLVRAGLGEIGLHMSTCRRLGSSYQCSPGCPMPARKARR